MTIESKAEAAIRRCHSGEVSVAYALQLLKDAAGELEITLGYYPDELAGDGEYPPLADLAANLLGQMRVVIGRMESVSGRSLARSFFCVGFALPGCRSTSSFW